MSRAIVWRSAGGRRWQNGAHGLTLAGAQTGGILVGGILCHFWHFGDWYIMRQNGLQTATCDQKVYHGTKMAVRRVFMHPASLN
jgi:hypothetical protein